MEDALDRRARAQHLADLAVPSLGDVAMVDMLTSEGSIERIAARSRGTEVADIFVKLRAEHADRPARAPPGRRGDPHRPDEVPRPALRRGDRSDHDPGERAGAAPPASVQVVHRAPARRPRVGARRPHPLDHAAGQGLRRDRPTHREAARRQRPPSRSTTPACTSSRPTSPRSSSTACCRARCPRSRASRPPRASWPPARPTRSAATSTTSSGAAPGPGRP